MIKKLSLGGVFERINELKSKTSLDEQNVAKNLKTEDSHSEVLDEPTSHNSEETVSKFDPVEAKNELRQGEKLTLSEMNPVQNSPCLNLTELKIDPVQISQCQQMTESNNDPVVLVKNSSEEVKPKSSKNYGGFTAVPNEILRHSGSFKEPIDFMVYLHLLSFSVGFGRTTADMGLAQLQAFTSASRNTIRKSLERLEHQKLIKKVSEYECGQVTRRWEIKLPTENPPIGGNRGSNSDRVQNSPGQQLTERESKSHPVTGSKIDTYKESITNKISKKSLSREHFENLEVLPQKLKNYFETLKPISKFEHEWKAFQTLAQEYEPEFIEKAFEHLKRYGLPSSGESCHSPMAFLKIGISQVKLDRGVQAPKSEIPQILPSAMASDFDSDVSISKLISQIPTISERKEIVKQLTSDFPGIDPEGPFALNLAARRFETRGNLLYG